MTSIPVDGLALSQALNGQYEILREVGRGGMGIVFLARDLKLERLIAIKTLPPNLAADDVIRARFLREARTAAALTHPNIVPIHRADDIDGTVFFVMGFVDGPSLAQLIRDGGPLTPRTAVSVLYDVADALGYAHRAGVIHRDVKAENILIDRGSSRALVTDFGIARVAEAAPLTATGTVLGTVHYMSPEQVAGDAVDPRSDVYSLGVVAFYALAGRFPFDSPTASAVLVAHVTKEAPSLSNIAPSVPRALARLVDRCLAKDRDSRVQSCEELLVELRRVESALPDDDVAAPRPEAVAVVSSDEAQALWQRAAQLQDMTGQMPPLRIADRTPVKRDLATAGYGIDQVRNAAREAGIETKFVDRAMAERGIVRAPDERGDDPASGVVREGILPGFNWWLGGRSAIGYEAVVHGEMPERDFDLLVEEIRRALNDNGVVSVVGRSLNWTSADKQRKVQISVLVRDGRTTIYVGERLKDLIGAIYGGVIGGGGGGTMGPIMGITMGALEMPWL
ncbi:MAG TPA: serine/threonine-protein kinase, partial [Gemmatimonadaceae bacterium]|nr:serine/threonine-protein kinase [Gemmatimonadaceae bacterium]